MEKRTPELCNVAAPHVSVHNLSQQPRVKSAHLLLLHTHLQCPKSTLLCSSAMHYLAVEGYCTAALRVMVLVLLCVEQSAA